MQRLSGILEPLGLVSVSVGAYGVDWRAGAIVSGVILTGYAFVIGKVSQ